VRRILIEVVVGCRFVVGCGFVVAAGPGTIGDHADPDRHDAGLDQALEPGVRLQRDHPSPIHVHGA
jgi:hypothetical protein